MVLLITFLFTINIFSNYFMTSVVFELLFEKISLLCPRVWSRSSLVSKASTKQVYVNKNYLTLFLTTVCFNCISTIYLLVEEEDQKGGGNR